MQVISLAQAKETKGGEGVTELVKYEAARHALAEAKAVDEVKKIHDVAAAMKAYARQANDRQLEIDAGEIRIRAERRLGEMIRAQKEGEGLAKGGQPYQSTGAEMEPVGKSVPTLAQVGISKKLSSRSQAIAAIPEDEFEGTLAEHREQQQAVTAATMEKLTKKGQEATEKRHKGSNADSRRLIELVDEIMAMVRTIESLNLPNSYRPEAVAMCEQLNARIGKMTDKIRRMQ